MSTVVLKEKKNKNNKKDNEAKAKKLAKKTQKKNNRMKNRAILVSAKPRTWGGETQREIQQSIREAKAYDAVDGSYVKCVFDPLSHKAARIPSIFPTPTALFKFTEILDVIVQPTSAVARSHVVIMPWNLSEGGTAASNTPAFINFGTNLNAVPASEYTLRVPHKMQGFMGDLMQTASRYSSYRAVACQAVLECTAPILNIQGTITGGFFPGLGYTAFSGNTPTATQLTQHPFGFQRAIKDLSSEWPFQVNYFPLDPLDQTFHNTSEPSDDVKSRSPMFIVFENITAAIPFRIKVTTVIEYCPTLSFCSWSNTDFGFDAPRSLEVVKSIVSTQGKAAVSGAMDKQIGNLPDKTSGDSFLSFIKKAGRAVSVFTDELGGIPKLFGSAIRATTEIL